MIEICPMTLKEANAYEVDLYPAQMKIRFEKGESIC